MEDHIMKEETLGSRIRRIREERGMTASELARLVDVTPTAVWNWENNGTQPRQGVLSALAKVFGITTESLLSGNVDPAKGRRVESTVAEIIENAKSQISKIAGFPLDRVKVHVEFVAE
jgi:transcriptional regulator with XRE-family HTH domain